MTAASSPPKKLASPARCPTAIPPNYPGRRWYLPSVVGLFLAAELINLLVFRRPYSGDDICHHMIARDAALEPRLLLHIWGRPGFTLIHLLPSQFGFDATRITSILLSLATGLLVARWLRDRGGLIAALGLAFCLFQGVFFELADGALTETVYALSLAAGLVLLKEKRLHFAALCFSYGAICRLEGGAFLPLFAGAFILQARAEGRLRSALLPVGLLGLFPFLWNLLCAADTGWKHLLPIVTQNQFVSAENSHYGSGPWYHFLLQSPIIHGPIVLVLMVIGICVMWKQRQRLIPLYIAAFYALQSTLWAGGWFRTAGYNRFFASIAPAVAIAAAWGAETLLHRLARSHCRERLQLATGALVVATALVAGISNAAQRRFTEGNYKAVENAVELIRARGGVGPKKRLLTPNMYAQLLFNLGPYQRKGIHIPWSRAEIERAPLGTWILFVGHRPQPYEATKTEGRFPALDFFTQDEAERLADRIDRGKSYIHLLRKTRPRYELVADFSCVGRTPFISADDDPYPVFVKLLRVVAAPNPAPQPKPDTAGKKSETWVWGN